MNKAAELIYLKNKELQTGQKMGQKSILRPCPIGVEYGVRTQFHLDYFLKINNNSIFIIKHLQLKKGTRSVSDSVSHQSQTSSTP